MEPVSIIITALGAGAIAATKDTAGTAVKDAYQGLKTLIKKRFADQGKEDDSNIVDKHEKKLDSEAVKALLKEELVNLGVDKDAEIIKLAQELLKQEKPEESAAGKYNTVFQGEVKGIQVGDRNTQENKFS
ncbi:hypothetical protein NIES4072_09010 [Nostoc commune NIES-4072]|uniref:Uncharacterized protein n=1 Tax=Nostoc commune NIES-4072 TaxID=2005467 RepID=A0A2R5FFF0_NOSCO|nr:hypothetical protein [Nostoc commune]BBD65424.1 hypothetical protein NIES4070_17820 [Nostoc commune HK-02]GBG17252.1 hypothetical protein NIES4072_09010 [Nostoc commune NIES-4072]